MKHHLNTLYGTTRESYPAKDGERIALQQAELLARHIRGDMEAYPPVVIR